MNAVASYSSAKHNQSKFLVAGPWWRDRLLVSNLVLWDQYYTVKWFISSSVRVIRVAYNKSLIAS
jgi:hypothetical protein